MIEYIHLSLIDFSNFLALCSSSTACFALLYTAASSSSKNSSLSCKFDSIDRDSWPPYDIKLFLSIKFLSIFKFGID